MHTWRWQTWNDLSYLTCSLLDSFSHGFFTRSFWPQKPKDLSRILHPTATVHRVKQVHGNTMLSPSEIRQAVTATVAAEIASPTESDLEPPAADGLLTEAPEQAVWVCSADCNPVLIADPVRGQVAAVHAGWRGTAQKIVPAAIARLQAQGSQLKHLRVAMGPAIAGEVYQVSDQVAAEVAATIVPAEQFETVEAMLDHVQQIEHPPLLPDPQPGRFRLDVRRVNCLQVEQLGTPPEQIAIAPHCTYQEPEHFFSYRRTREKKVQWSGIVSRS
ncbi:MAG: peptidoglycan editing factor PgeF [Leptolyngbyaceae cyanobacterium MO_188.B28]|nr:peptidoglycan editing factor PgeF [Leptolyngbyaceae cyanobacterium MO_188.B28]